MYTPEEITEMVNSQNAFDKLKEEKQNAKISSDAVKQYIANKKDNPLAGKDLFPKNK